MIVQIYEIQTAEEAEKCIELGVDHIGSVLLSEDGWRVPDLKEVIRLSEHTRAKNTLIPLFKDRTTLYRALDYYRPHYVHFCDNLIHRDDKEAEAEGFIEFQSNLKQEFPEIRIMRSIPVPEKSKTNHFPVLKIAHLLEPVSDIFLTDTWLGKEPVQGYVGITGKTADWEMAMKIVLQSNIPVILAGGLSPENVYEALMKISPAGADSCTHTNMADGAGKPTRFKKDFKKVEKFAKEIRRAENAIRLKGEQLKKEIEGLKAEMREREAALPAHSVRPHQVMAIEKLEEEIAGKERELKISEEI